MNYRNLQAWAVLLVSALITIGCASTSLYAPQEVATQSEPENLPPSRSSDDGGFEEVVVAGNRRNERGRSDQERMQSTRSATTPSLPSAEAIGITGYVNNSALQAGADGIDAFLAKVGDEELWIISKADVADPATNNDEPGTGAMMATFEQKEVPLPLKHTDVSARIAGYISTVNVRQQFENPYDSKIEAVYMFPLPEKAAISEFLMIIGERKIRGILREKEEAKQIYEAARSQGYQASLLVQHRPNIFEQKVANIEPGKSINVDIKYFHTLAYNDGWYSFIFPTVVGPRYNPPHSTDPISALPRTDSSSVTGVRYLKPTERSGHDISIEVSVDAGVKIEELRSTHKIIAERTDSNQASVSLAAEATLPNRDFILDFRVAGETMKSNLLTYVDPETQQGYFTMMLYPPEATDVIARRKMEMVFVIDSSGSMSGTPMAQAKDAVESALDNLQEGDTFQIIRFSDNASQFGRDPVPATRDNIVRAKRYLANLHGGGGTRMIEGIRAALNFPHDPSRFRFVSFLTDGYIGNEVEILAEIHQHIGAARIFSFGVGSSVNRYLMESMAKVGKGAVAYLGPQDSGSEIMSDFFRRISHPALTDVQIDWGGMAVSDVYPSTLPDLFVGRPLVVTGLFTGAPSSIAVLGHGSEGERRQAIKSDSGSEGASSLAKIWARLRVEDLDHRRSIGGDPDGEFATAIRETALRYQLMSEYTSFVAVDSSKRTAGDHGTTVHQAVPVPAGVKYETTIGQEGSQ